jgi:large subunit ribosomal protein L9
MKVILLDNIRGIGRVGDVKDVSDGYARNFLIARGKARPASAGAAREAQSLQAKRREAMDAARGEAEQLRDRLTSLTVTVRGTASPKGKLFAAIESATVAAQLSELLQVHIDPSQLHPLDHLKTVGEHEVGVTLPGGLSGTVRVLIEPAER